MSDHDHPLPPPEPDALPLLKVTLWGVGSFVAVVAIIIALGSYFWLEREAEDVVKIGQTETLAPGQQEAQLKEAERLKGIESAMDELAGQKEIR